MDVIRNGDKLTGTYYGLAFTDEPAQVRRSGVDTRVYVGDLFASRVQLR